MNKIALREKYYNRLTDLQYKRKDKHEDFIVIGLILAYLMEYLTNGNEQVMMFKAPFILQIKNLENDRAVVKAVDEALNLQGKLAEPIKEFKKINAKSIETLTYIIPKKTPKIKIMGEKKVVAKSEEKADLMEDNQKIGIITNKVVLNKKGKTWNTQRDSKVRKTAFHRDIDRQTKPIDEYFIVDGYKAMYPSDSTLPQFDRINCRCYLTYW
jgi:hypothetical protein